MFSQRRALKLLIGLSNPHARRAIVHRYRENANEHFSLYALHSHRIAALM